jgi:uncharacterized protein YprB with RNaseH-like and TPR domain
VSDLQSQLELLRKKIARIDRKYADGPPPVDPAAAVTGFSRITDEEERAYVEEWLPGEEVENERGKHFQTRRFWERYKRHGSIDISSLAELPADLLEAVSEGTVPACPPHKWAFIDTETTGLAGGTGTCAFLIGLGWVTDEGFRLKQYFLREPGEEASALEALREDLEPFDVLVTYNGRAFDQPLLETRFRLARQKPPFARMAHMDLLYGARRLWKLRFDNCRLVELETQVLGVEREGDVPGELIPYLYFEYLRKREIARLVPVFHHNAIDILTLACLTAIVPWAFREPSEARLAHGAEMIGVARWMRKAERWEEAIQWMRQGLQKPIAEDLAFRAMWDIAQLERKLGRDEAARVLYGELAAVPNAHRVAALEELAKHCEHRVRDYRSASEYVRTALLIADSAELRHRAARLEKKLRRSSCGGAGEEPGLLL